MQQTRFEGKGLICNADMGVAEVREFCGVDGAGRNLLQTAMQQLGMSAHSHHRIPSLRSGKASSSPAPSAICWAGR